jgi:hypothetical protein
VIVASGRLRAATPVAIGVDMHLTALLNVVRRWRMAVAGGQERRAGAFAAFHVRGRPRRVVMAAPSASPART